MKLPEPGTGVKRGMGEGVGVAVWDCSVRCLRSLNEKMSLGIFFNERQNV